MTAHATDFTKAQAAAVYGVIERMPLALAGLTHDDFPPDEWQSIRDAVMREAERMTREEAVEYGVRLSARRAAASHAADHDLYSEAVYDAAIGLLGDMSK